MPASIFGDRFMGVREPAWHGLGTVIKEPVPIAQAMEIAKVQYDVVKYPVVVPIMSDDGTFEEVLATDQFALVREGTEEGRHVFGIVSDDYQPLQNYELARMLEPLNDKWPIETVGALGQGEIVFFTLDAGEFTVNGSDKVKRYVLASTGHDGKSAVRWALVQTRVVCTNTFQWALSSADMSYSIPHKGDVKAETQLVADLFEGLERNIETDTRVTQQLGAVKITDDDADEVFEAAYPKPKQSRKALQVASAAASQSITKDQVKRLLQDDSKRTANHFQAQMERRERLIAGTREVYGHINGSYPDIANTAWAAFNAVTEVSNWREGPNADRAVMFGVRGDEMNRARSRVLELIGV